MLAVLQAVDVLAHPEARLAVVISAERERRKRAREIARRVGIDSPTVISGHELEGATPERLQQLVRTTFSTNNALVILIAVVGQRLLAWMLGGRPLLRSLQHA